jgi:hypothetical protein
MMFTHRVHKSFMRWIVILGLGLGLAPQGWANQGNVLVEDSVKDFTTVMVIGAGGAVLGLSTLSFVSRPKKHLRNILVGGAVGIIVGVGYVAYKQANASKTIIQGADLGIDPLEYSTTQRLGWHASRVNAFESESPIPHLTYQFSF